MRWIEIIRLRSTGNRDASFVESLGRAVAATVDSSQVRIFRHGSVSTDLAVHIVHETSGERPDESLGERLAGMLEEQGLVSRSLWIEMSSDDDDGRSK